MTTKNALYQCPRCQGNLFISHDHGWQAECLQCSRIFMLEIDDYRIPNDRRRYEVAQAYGSAFSVHTTKASAGRTARYL